MLRVTPVRAFSDNYIWLIHAPAGDRRVAVVDPGDARPVLETLAREGLELAAILLTHHHFDHVGGVAGLLERHPAPVYGPADRRIGNVDHVLGEGDVATIEALALRFEVYEVPGHTIGHIAFYGHGALFCGDTLFSGGCGRLFEGTPGQMVASLDKLAALPGETRVYCAHEYTAANLRFARAVEPDNAAVTSYAERVRALREADRPSLPSTLELEREVNPFLRCHLASVRETAQSRSGRPLDDRVAVFATVREWKDSF